ncbi:MAG TPA: lmo0937 family membrane protein [Bacteroidales bacterium]|jgi:hypothetical protein|nr:lmo0937 family membrane protein [Bacteroidales bacterium]HBG71598.1 lmo0937 family membrane protein [Bacteroidales bacterium]HCB62131.1 lmo0937 family membrane protein [Bacteroidales bacterium]HCY22359.1 lmo0937 family membrane protein [Bacteroidales bacterium]
MKNSLYIIAALLIVIWSIIYFNFQTGSLVHALLILAGVIILIRIIFNNSLTGK